MDALLHLLPVAAVSYYGSKLDRIVLVSYETWKDWNFIQPYLQEYVVSQIDFRLVLILATTFAFSLFALQINRAILGFQTSSTDRKDFTAKPMLFPCMTAHTRFFPRKHHFSYSFLMAGVPVGTKGISGGMLSVDLPVTNRNWAQRLFSLKPWSSWYTVNADDHLGRGHVEGGLEKKLHDYLHTQDENPNDYPFAYLMAPPRLFGYYSNPVSFWNLYSPDKTLSAMILEVNNTFDERHNYFLKVDPKTAATVRADHPPRFIQHWPKDFHVSVFNSREGSYSLSASDPIYPALSGPGNLNATITLSSSKSHPKLVARVFSISPALDPETMSVSEKTTFLAKWWWVSFLTFPRTVQQALTLMWTKKMRFVSRPEPRANTMPRDADSFEGTIEHYFKEYLQSVIEKCETPFILKYIPAGVLDIQGDTMLSSSAQLTPRDECEYLEIRILTPLFYSRFISYPKALNALLSEHHESQTLRISNPTSLDSLDFSAFTPSPPRSTSLLANLDDVRLALLKSLRTRPVPIENEETIKRKIKKNKSLYVPLQHDNFSAQSDFDNFVIHQYGTPDKLIYTVTVAKMFLANIFGFGSMQLLDLEVLALRCGLVCFVAGYCLH